MHIKKIGHCCLRIDEQDVSVLIDPGSWTTAQNDEKGIHAILITQEHADHLNVESIRKIIENNPDVKIFTNTGVGEILKREQISFELLEDGQETEVFGVKIKGLGRKHADIYPSIIPVDNTGYLIAGRFFYPGDALFVPKESVEILALPVAGPWLTISQSIDYAKQINPKICFPVHDGMLKILGPFHSLPEKLLTPLGINFISLTDGLDLNV